LRRFLIPVNRFRPTIRRENVGGARAQSTGGDLGLSLLRGALTAKDLSIGDDPKFSSSPFLTAKSLSVWRRNDAIDFFQARST
jgi:AsmA protein